MPVSKINGNKFQLLTQKMLPKKHQKEKREDKSYKYDLGPLEQNIQSQSKKKRQILTAPTQYIVIQGCSPQQGRNCKITKQNLIIGKNFGQMWWTTWSSSTSLTVKGKKKTTDQLPTFREWPCMLQHQQFVLPKPLVQPPSLWHRI